MNPACGLARKATAAATSSGLPNRPTLVNRFMASKVGPAVGWGSGWTTAGCTLLTVIPAGPRSRDQPRVNPCTANLVAP